MNVVEVLEAMNKSPYGVYAVDADQRMDDARAEEVAESVRGLIVSDDDRHLLTPSEIRVLRMVASSIEDSEIADRLGITLHTVHAHIRNARKKLNAKDRLDAVLAAQRRGLL